MNYLRFKLVQFWCSLKNLKSLVCFARLFSGGAFVVFCVRELNKSQFPGKVEPTLL